MYAVHSPQHRTIDSSDYYSRPSDMHIVYLDTPNSTEANIADRIEDFKCGYLTHPEAIELFRDLIDVNMLDELEIDPDNKPILDLIVSLYDELLDIS